ncbi:MAG TPA: toll/interleukin-1 receptor domain-containing protein [Verrucomicrobiae bacterium]|nr:toll/interleukin-1 receptor domain-containing protein [Verrucomicrobiae bacterium]
MSYSRKDKLVVRALAKRLKSSGLTVWLDEWEVRPGDEILGRIEEGMEASRVMVFCISRHTTGSQWTKLEQGTFRFRDPTNRDRRFIPLRLDNSKVKDSLKQFAFIDYRNKSKRAFDKLLASIRSLADINAVIGSRVSKGIREKDVALTRAPHISRGRSLIELGKSRRTSDASAPSAGDRKEFEVLCRKSFEYCLERKLHPKSDSNTCMYFYGLNFNPQSPKLRPIAVVQAIGTELDHLDKVVFWDESHNPGKHSGVEQIADEIVDMFRYVFILAIVHGIEEWKANKWTEIFCQPYMDSDFATTWSECSRVLQHLYQELQTTFNRNTQYNETFIRRWINRQLLALGRVARCEKISIRDLIKDLHQRLHEDRNAPNATTQHSRHSFPTQGEYLVCQAHFPEVPGTYRVLLNQIADHDFDIWASISKAVVYGETAEAWLLLALAEKEKPSDQEIAERIERIQHKVVSSYAGNTSMRNRRLFSLKVWSEKHFMARNEGEFLKALSTALSEFWSLTKD